MRLVFAGTPEPAVTALEVLLASRHDIVGVVTRPDAPAGRGRTLTPSPVAARAAKEGLPVLTPRRASEPEFLDALAALAPDCCPVVAYGNLLRPSALAVPRVGWVNLHFSLLPAWRGAAPVQHAILAGDDVTGASTFLIEEGLDSGPVFGTVTEPIHPDDTAGDLLGRLATAGAGLLMVTLDGIEDGSVTAVRQPAEGVSLAPKITTEDARVDFGVPALRIDRQIRACTPAPGPWTLFRGERLKLGPVRLRADAGGPPGQGDGLVPGEIAVGRDAVLVGTGSHAVALSTVQPPGRRLMPALDWARGARLHGERLGGPRSDVPSEPEPEAAS